MVDTVTSGEDQGANFLAQIDAEQRKTSAYNALNKQYGPGIAGDPQAAADAAKAALLQSTQQSTSDLTNTQNQATQAGTTYNAATLGPQAGSEATQATNDAAHMAKYKQGYLALGNAADAAVKSPTDQVGSIPADVVDSTIGAHLADYNLDPSIYPGLKAQLTAPGGAAYAQQLQKRLGIMSGIGTVSGTVQYGKDAQGNDVMYSHDKAGNLTTTPLGAGNQVAPQERVDTGNVNAATNKAKLPIMQQNANANSLRAANTHNNTNFGPGVAAGGVPQPGAVHKPNADGTATTPNFDQLAPVGSKARATAIASAQSIVNSDTMIQNFNNVVSQINQQIPAGAGSGTLIKDLPGSVQHNLEQNLATAKAGELTSWIASLKNSSGQTGIGALRVPEINAAQAALGSMDQGQTVGQLQYHVKLAQQAINQIHSTAGNAFKTQWKQDPYALLGAQPGQGGSGTPAKQGAAGPQKITSNADYAALKSGTQFLAPDGTTRTKP